MLCLCYCLNKRHITSLQLDGYANTCLLDMPKITMKHCNVLNPATLLPIPGDGDEHNCVAVVNAVCSPRVNLTEIPLENVEMELFIDAVLLPKRLSTCKCEAHISNDDFIFRETPRLMRPPRRLHVTLLTIPLTCMTPHHLLPPQPDYSNCMPSVQPTM